MGADRGREDSDDDPPLTVREATAADHNDVVAFTADTWADRGSSDYIPDVYHDWIDREGSRTFAAVAGDGPAEGRVVGIVQAVILSPWEAWYQGMRVHPDYRGRGVSRVLNRASFAWSRDRGAAVGRLMTFSWNAPALGAARANGFAPTTEFRWMHPEPDPDASGGFGIDAGYDAESEAGVEPGADAGGAAGCQEPAKVVEDPDAAYAGWAGSDARVHLRGLALDRGESWACSELTREDLRAAAEETRTLAVRRPGGPGEDGRGGVRAMTFRTRDYERPTDDGGVERWAEYGVAAWADLPALRTLVAAIARDAAGVGADRTRVLIPETARHVSDAARAAASIAEGPDFVLSADLTGVDG